MADISIIGAGAWGSGLYFALKQKQPCTIASRRELGGEFDQVPLEEALKSPYLIIAISTQKLRGWLESSFVYQGQNLLIASKGIEASSGAFINEILETRVPKERLAYLRGPTFAKEVRASLPTAMSIHSHNLKLAREFGAFFPVFIKTYESGDVIGGEVASAYKNVIAIASGICDGLGLGNNARASLISRGLVEISRFGECFGALPTTFLGLSGAGDLFLTCSSNLSRNYRVGYALAGGRELDDILRELGETAEGVKTTRAIISLSKKHGIYTPIAAEVDQILDGKDAKASLKDLLAKE